MVDKNSSVEEVEEGERPEIFLCTHCLAENMPTWNFCQDCGAPMDFCSSTVPFQTIWAEGWVYRQAVERPKPILFIGILLLFGVPGFAVVLAMLSGAVAIQSLPELAFCGPPLGLLAFGIVILTRMSLRWRELNMIPVGDVENDDQ